MLAAYSACTRYEDEGTVDGPLGRHWFRTQFERSAALTFDFGEWDGDKERRQFLLSHGPLATSLWCARDGAIEDYDDLGLAVAALTGVTSGVAHTVPPLLIAELRGRTLRHLTDLRLIGTEDVAGETCRVIEGGYSDRNDCRDTLWIGVRVPWLMKRATAILAPGLEGTFLSVYRPRGA